MHVTETAQLYGTLMSLGGLATALLAFAVGRQRGTPGSTALGVALVCCGLWMVGSGAEVGLGSLALATFFVHLKYTATAFVAPAFLTFCLRFTGRLSRRSAIPYALCAIPLVTVALVWTNPHHEWMWREPLTGPDGQVLSRLHWGPWFWRVHTPYSYALLALAALGLATRLAGESALYRRQARIILALSALPIVTNVVFLAGLGSDRFSLTPLAFGLMAVGVSWAVFHQQLFRTAPVAYRTAFAHIPDALLVVDPSGLVLDANPAACALLELAPDAGGALGRSLTQLGETGRELALLHARAGAGDAELALPTGRRLEVVFSPIADHPGGERGGILIARDVTERLNAERALRENEAVLRGIVEHSPNGILRIRPTRGLDGRVRDFECTYANPAAAEGFGRTPEEMEGLRLGRALPGQAAMLLEIFREVLRTGVARDAERRLQLPGYEGWFRFITVRVGADLLLTVVDVTEPKQRELSIAAAAARDPLTGLLNRRGFEDDAAALVEQLVASRRGGALFFLDLDDFKAVNDQRGHAAGDQVLRDFAGTLAAMTRPDSLLARYGGDEFVLLVPDIGEEAARRLGMRLAAEGLGDCAASVGVAFLPRHGGELTALLRAADSAMYSAKQAAGGFQEA